MIVGPAAHLAVIGGEQRGAVGDGSGGREPDHGAVALRRGAKDSELLDWCGGKRRGDRPSSISELMHPAQTQADVERPAAAHVEARPEVGAEDGAHRGRGLLRNGEIEQAAAAFCDACLIDRTDLQAAERADRGVGRKGQAEFVAGLGLAEELVGTGLSVGNGGREARDGDDTLQAVVRVGVARQRVGLEPVSVGVLRERAVERDAQ